MTKQQKKEHKKIYSWYFYQLTCSDKKKKMKGEELTEGRKAKKERKGKKEYYKYIVRPTLSISR